MFCVHIVLPVVCVSGVAIPAPLASPWLNVEQVSLRSGRSVSLGNDDDDAGKDDDSPPEF